jgi:murein DD-endopeptidase MepM/ murein hydrolase activator NlpD
LPVIGLGNSPSEFAGGAPAWSSGSYGYRKPASKGGHLHRGVDIYANRGTSVIAPVAGTIKTIGEARGSGKYVLVAGDDGNTYYYAHLNNIQDTISRGMKVNQGTVLGGVGNSGNAQGTGTHLHFEVRRNGHAISPNEFLQTGTIQETTPLSSIPGLYGEEQVQALLDEQRRAIGIINGIDPFDPATWNQPSEESEEERQLAQTIEGQGMLGKTLNSMSNVLAGGSRTAIPKLSTALVTDGEEAPVPEAAQQRQVAP